MCKRVRFILIVSMMVLGGWVYGQAPKRDTLFFRLDHKFLKENELNHENYFLDDITTGEAFYFKSIKQLENLRPHKVFNFKRYITKHGCFNKKNNKANHFEIYRLLENRIVFLEVKDRGNKYYIKVRANYEIY